MKMLAFAKEICLATIFCVVVAVASFAQTYNVLFDFNGSNGTGGVALTQGPDGNFYGTSGEGGRGYTSQSGGGDGTMFKVSSSGKFTLLHKFCSQSKCADGVSPGSLVLGVNGNFYGTTYYGGTGTGTMIGCGVTCGGTFFEITPAGELTTLYSFCSQKNCADGSNPVGAAPFSIGEGPVLATNGHYYGTAYQGGSDICFDGCGTVYDITTSGAQSTLYDLCTQVSCPDDDGGGVGLVLGNNGRFYGLQLNDGEPSIPGLIFDVTSQGKYETIYTFKQGDDGYQPVLLIQGSDGDLYGAATLGANGSGTLFKVTPSGEFTTLYSFCSQTNCADGAQPSSLIEGSDGNFYGTTLWGNHNSACLPYEGCGTIFKITPSGEYTVLYTFCSQANCTDGANPVSLMQATNGTFYGGAAGGVTDGTCYLNQGCGGIFSLSVGLGPFVKANPNFGKAGSKVTILGNNLTGTTSVTFNGTPATFTVGSGGTYIKADVPTGATTGTIEVTTPSGTLNSNVAFQVLE
jgi:uncharacterized repeat protein (TIGR03803 family)